MQYFFGILSFLTSLFLILLILIQRGRGGGLAGALGGMGGQSAFGTKAGDLFTRITIGVAAFWILLSVAAIAVLNKSHSVFGEANSSAFSTGDAEKEQSKLDSKLGPDAKGTPGSPATSATFDSKGGASLTGAPAATTAPSGEPATPAAAPPATPEAAPPAAPAKDAPAKDAPAAEKK